MKELTAISVTDSQAKPSAAPNVTAASYIATLSTSHPHVAAKAVTDPATLKRARYYWQAIKQTEPLARSEASIRNAAKVIQQGTAHTKSLRLPTAQNMVANGRSLESMVAGQNPSGTAAEIIATDIYMSMHRGENTGLVNPPTHLADNLIEIRISADCASRKDLVFVLKVGNGGKMMVYNGQVKTGGPEYVANSLVKMANTPGYGKVAYVDARYVNADGTPRIAADAFTEEQARRLSEAKVRLRGIPDLEKDASQLVVDIKEGIKDGLDPIERKIQQQIRDDIVAAYRLMPTAGRMAVSAGSAAAIAILISLAVQLAVDGQINAPETAKAAAVSAGLGAAGVAIDAGFYHLGSWWREMTPEAAKQFASTSTAAFFSFLAVATDLYEEGRLALDGHATAADTVAGSSFRVALNLLPLAIMPTGILGLPLMLAAQVGGRWSVAMIRNQDRQLAIAFAQDMQHADSIRQQIETLEDGFERLCAESADVDTLFQTVMPAPHRSAQLVYLPSLQQR